MTELRKELPELPYRMRRLPVDGRGYPVPWFVAWLDEDGGRAEPGEGQPEFRVMDELRLTEAVKFGLCWVCGQRLGACKAFTVGPMCTVNLTSGEPPSHLVCSLFSAEGCPFLSRPHARRREEGLPEGHTSAGISIQRNPGVTCVWVTKGFSITRARRTDGAAGVLFKLGKPEQVKWFSQGREATRDEVVESINSGLPALREYADGPMAHKSLDRLVEKAMERVPA